MKPLNSWQKTICPRVFRLYKCLLLY